MEKKEMRQHGTKLAQSNDWGDEPFLELALHKERPWPHLHDPEGVRGVSKKSKVSDDQGGERKAKLWGYCLTKRTGSVLTGAWVQPFPHELRQAGPPVSSSWSWWFFLNSQDSCTWLLLISTPQNLTNPQGTSLGDILDLENFFFYLILNI